MREGLTRAFWPALVIVAFCVPLFAGLDRTDLQNDEAIYSYGVDGILAHGDWLNPRSSPDFNTVFLEKPPLKFWMVAAPIRLGLLPHDEFGLRAVDALLGGLAFLYVLAIGWRLAGPLCGAIAVMTLFLYQPLLLVHGIRGNNMEAPLLLAYCGGVYHWMAWAAADRQVRRRAHIAAIGIFFYLGFMTKFVAVLFLPVVLGIATILYSEPRRRLQRDWCWWALAFGVFLLLAAPWFVYQQMTAGNVLWRVMFAEHVYTRFTTTVDPLHMRPWDYYFVAVFTEFQRNGTYVLALGGLLLLIVGAIGLPAGAVAEAGRVQPLWRLRLAGTSRDLFVTVAWFLVPVSLISLVTSKLHHYAYPFLPPLALAVGYALVWLLRTIEPAARLALTWTTRRTAGIRRWPSLSGVLTAVGVIAVALGVLTLAFGPLEYRVPGVGVVTNSRVGRPLLVAAILFVLAGHARAGLTMGALLLLTSLIPVHGYRHSLNALAHTAHPLRSMRDCLVSVRNAETAGGGPSQPIYAVAPDRWFLHPYFYYFRHVGGWERADAVDDRALAAALRDEPRPVLIHNDDYAAFKHRQQTTVPSPRIVTMQTVLLLLPGPYARCAGAYTRPVMY